MNRPRSFAMLIAATALATIWSSPALAADPPAGDLVIKRPPAGFTPADSPDSNGPLDLEKAVAFLGNDDETRDDLKADKFTGGHVATYTKAQTALLSAVFVFEKEIPGDEFVSDAKDGLNEGDAQTQEFETGLPDAIGVSTGTGAEQTHVVLFAKRHHAFLDVLAGPDGTQQQLIEIVRAHHAQLSMLEPAVEENLAYSLGQGVGRIVAIAVIAGLVALVVNKVRSRKQAPAAAAAWDANAPAFGQPDAGAPPQWGTPPAPGEAPPPPAPPAQP